MNFNYTQTYKFININPKCSFLISQIWLNRWKLLHPNLPFGIDPSLLVYHPVPGSINLTF